jgi:hypothetical protein
MNWKEPSGKVSKYFTVKECCWLPSWGKLHSPTEAEAANMQAMALKMDLVREILGKPINVHVWIRPPEYNKLIGGAPKSAHITGRAVDFDCGEDCDITRTKLLPHLEKLGLRMEDLPGSRWVHLGNDWVPGNKHFFKP